MQRIGVFVIGDDTGFQEWLSCSLQEWKETLLLGTANAIWRGVQQIQAVRPDVVLWAERAAMVSNDLPLLAEVSVAVPRTRLLLCVDSNPPESMIHLLLATGVSGCLTKARPAGDFRKAIQGVYDGDVWFGRKALAEAYEYLRRQAPNSHPLAEDPKQPLTDREKQIVQWLGQGMQNKEIGRKLGITENTVKKHLQHIFHKLNVHRRFHAALSLEGTVKRGLTAQRGSD